MSQSPHDDSTNPYETPQTESAPFVAVPEEARGNVALSREVKKFRDQIHALGAFWIIIGGVSLVFAGLGPRGLGVAGPAPVPNEAIVRTVVGIAGGVWLAIGIATCLKQFWAVYTGLVLSYVSVVLHLVFFNLCWLVFYGMAILQGHRVLKWAKSFKRRGIPLTAKRTDFL